MNGSRSMSTAYASPTGFADEGEHFRDGSLLKRKQEQWAREKACTDSWFPFGTPGGGAPNRKYEPIDPHASDTRVEKRSPSRHSNGDSGRWSGSENNPSKEEPEGVAKGASERAPCPCSVASTSTAQPATIILAQPPQMIVEGGQQCLPPVGAHGASFIAQVSTPPGANTIPVQFVYASNAYGQTVPVPVEVVQSPSGVPSGIPYAYPVRVISPLAVNMPPTTSADGVRHELPVLPSSYTEHWANQLSYWGSSTLRQDENTKTSQTTQANIDSAACVSLPPIGGGMQPMTMPKSVALPLLASAHSGDRQFSPAQHSGTEDGMRQSMSESLTSLNSSSRRSMDGDPRGRAKQTEQIYNEQVAERRRLEAQRLEEEKIEAIMKEKERRRMEELELEREIEEERKKARAEEERSRTEAALLASIEKAKREAELLKKAKLYKHVLEDCEKSFDLERTILGEDDRENSRILKEVESLERQKKYDLQRMSGGGSQPSSAKRAFTERGCDINRSKSDSRNASFDDERPIRGTVNSFNTEPFSRDRRGRQSVRVPSTPKMSLPRRADSAERPRNDVDVTAAPTVSQRRRITSQCAIPVRPQRRIPPPTLRSRRTSANESSTSSTNQLFAEDCKGMPNNETPTSKKYQSVSEQTPTKMVLRETKSVSTEQEMQLSMFPSPLSNGESSASKRKQADAPQSIATSPMTHPKQRSGSFDMAAMMDATPKIHEKVRGRWKPKVTNGNEPFAAENPLFQPVTTRCRRSRVAMGNTDIARESSSCSSGSPPPLSTEDDSLSPPLNNATQVSSTEKDIAKTAIPKATTRSSAIKIPVNNSGTMENIAKSPFKQTLAEWGNTNRHREELLSPEIRRKGEFPNSTRLRNSMANLNSEESGDERASPVSPFLQRFNAKTSQYRSFNLKKTSERNQEVLDQLAQLRAQLKQKQQQMERSFATSNGSLLTRNRTSSAMGGVNGKSGEAVAAV